MLNNLHSELFNSQHSINTRGKSWSRRPHEFCFEKCQTELHGKPAGLQTVDGKKNMPSTIYSITKHNIIHGTNNVISEHHTYILISTEV